MKLKNVDYNKDNENWMDVENIPSNSRYILVYSPEFGTSIGYYRRFAETGGQWIDALRLNEKVNIQQWRELPKYENSKINI